MGRFGPSRVRIPPPPLTRQKESVSGSNRSRGLLPSKGRFAGRGRRKRAAFGACRLITSRSHADRMKRRVEQSPASSLDCKIEDAGRASSAEASCGAALALIAEDLGARHLVVLEAQELDGPSLNPSAAVRPGARVLEDGE